MITLKLISILKILKCLILKNVLFCSNKLSLRFPYCDEKRLGWQNFYCCWWTVTINYNRFASIIHHTSFFMFTIIVIYSLKEFVMQIVSPTINCHKIGHKTWYFAFQQCSIPRYYINWMCIGLIFLCHHWNKFSWNKNEIIDDSRLNNTCLTPYKSFMINIFIFYR